MFDKHYRRHWLECPFCLYYTDTDTTHVGSAAPDPGDGSICLNCGNLLEFQGTCLEDMQLIPMSDELIGHLQKQGDFSTLMKQQSFIQKRGMIPNYSRKPK